MLLVAEERDVTNRSSRKRKGREKLVLGEGWQRVGGVGGWGAAA